MTEQEFLNLSRDRFREEEEFKEKMFERVKFLWTALVVMGAADVAMMRTELTHDKCWDAFISLSVIFWIVFVIAAALTAWAYRPSKYFNLDTMNTYRLEMQEYIDSLTADGYSEEEAQAAGRIWIRRWHINAYSNLGSGNQMQNLRTNGRITMASYWTIALPLIIGVQALVFSMCTLETYSNGSSKTVSINTSTSAAGNNPVSASGSQQRKP